MTTLTRFRALWRMRSYVRPYWPRMLVMFVLAAVGVGASTVVPLVIMAIVDGPIRHGSRGALLPMFVIALVLGLAEAGMILARRLVQQRVILQVERQIRDDIYRHLQRLSVAFHDRWQIGQLLSSLSRLKRSRMR